MLPYAPVVFCFFLAGALAQTDFADLDSESLNAYHKRKIKKVKPLWALKPQETPEFRLGYDWDLNNPGGYSYASGGGSPPWNYGKPSENQNSQLPNGYNPNGSVNQLKETGAELGPTPGPINNGIGPTQPDNSQQTFIFQRPKPIQPPNNQMKPTHSQRPTYGESQPGYPQPGYPVTSYPQRPPGYPQPELPQRPTQTGYPQPGYPSQPIQPGYPQQPQPGYPQQPQPGYPQQPQPGYPQQPQPSYPQQPQPGYPQQPQPGYPQQPQPGYPQQPQPGYPQQPQPSYPQQPQPGYPQQPQPGYPQQPQPGYPLQPQQPGSQRPQPINPQQPQPGYPQQPQPGYPLQPQQPGSQRPQPINPQQPGSQRPQPINPQQPGSQKPQTGYPQKPQQPQPGFPPKPQQPESQKPQPSFPSKPQQPGFERPQQPQQPGSQRPQPSYPQQPQQPESERPQPSYPQQPQQPGLERPQQPQQPGSQQPQPSYPLPGYPQHPDNQIYPGHPFYPQTQPPIKPGELEGAGGVPGANGSASMEELRKYCKTPRGQFGTDRSCGSFINCWDDIVIEQECGNNLLFNEDKKYCDYPDNVDCMGRPITKPFTSPDGSCQSPLGTFRSTTNCGEFFVCVHGIANRFLCPAGTAYNEELGICDYPYRVECNGVPLIPLEEVSDELEYQSRAEAFADGYSAATHDSEIADDNNLSDSVVIHSA